MSHNCPNCKKDLVAGTTCQQCKDILPKEVELVVETPPVIVEVQEVVIEEETPKPAKVVVPKKKATIKETIKKTLKKKIK